MKMRPEHFAELAAAINPHDTAERRAQYRARNFRHADRCRDVNKRYRWDLMYASGIKIGDGKGMSGLPLYEYLDDDQIDTALRRIVPDLQDDFSDVKKPKPPHGGKINDPWGLGKLG